jgi:hypothetical protein
VSVPGGIIEHMFERRPAAFATTADLDLPAGPELLAALTCLAPGRLSDSELTRYVAAADRMSALVGSLGTAAVAELDRRLRPDLPQDEELARDQADGLDPEHDPAAAELMALSRCTRHSALNRIHAAVALAEQMPAVLAAWRAAEISPGHVRAYTELLDGRSPAVTARVVRRTLHTARRASVTRLRRVIRIELAAAEPPVELPDGQANLGRYLKIERPAGCLHGQFAPDELALIDAALSSLASRVAGDARDRDTRLADALVELCSHHLPLAAGGTPTSTGGTRVHIGVVTTAETLLGLDDRPAELLGYGPIGADVARRLSCNGLFTRLLTDPQTGQLLDLGRTHRDPSESLRRYIAARDQHCQFPGCHVPAHRCEPHHVDFWSRGGRTDRRNLVTTCRRHHRAVHEGGWRASRPDEHTTLWVSPTGTRTRTYAPGHPRDG